MFITGCHRSGTSLMASIVSDVLTDRRTDAPLESLAQRSDLEPTLDNPKGFFESLSVRSFNEKLLELAGCTWDRPPVLGIDWTEALPLSSYEAARVEFRQMGLDRFWVDKDPRLSLTYRAWIHVFLRRPPLAVLIREPLEVAVSLHSRNASGWDLDRGLVFWFLYNHHLSHVIQPGDLLVTYQQLLASSEDSLLRFSTALSHWLFEQVSLTAPPELCQSQVVQRVDRLLDRSSGTLDLVSSYSPPRPSLHHLCQLAYENVRNSSDPLSAFVESFSQLPRELLDVCSSHGRWFGFGVAASQEIASLQQDFNQERLALHQERLTLQQQLLTHEQERERLEQHLEEHRQLILRQQSQLQSVYRSFSWRCTAPCRWFGAALRRDR